LELSEEVAEVYRQNIRNKYSRFLWRYSGSLAFHQLYIGNQQVRVGLNNKRDRFYSYSEPPEWMRELRSSLRLFEQPNLVETALVMVRCGEATLVEEINEYNRLYCIEMEGETYFFEYSIVRDEIDVCRQPKADEREQCWL
jgi:hypothetical protein